MIRKELTGFISLFRTSRGFSGRLGGITNTNVHTAYHLFISTVTQNIL